MTQFLVWIAVHASQWVLFLYFLVVNSIYTTLIFLALRDIVRHSYLTTARSARRQLAGEFYYKPVSVIMPAHNEGPVIIQSVKALLNLHFPEFEVIVVSDGSTDDTLEKLKKEFSLASSIKPVRLQVPHEDIVCVYRSELYSNLIVVDKVNGGKADAINAGINLSSYPIFCSIDADSLLEPDAILKSSKLFLEDDSLIATGGIIRILNGCKVKDGAVLEIGLPAKTLEAMQVLEYTRAFLSGRTGWNALDSLLIISGAFGVFRKDMVIAINGYRKTVGEDMDLVMRLHRHCHEKDIPYKILFVPDPVCWTQAPYSLKMLLKQRNRWHRGMIDALLTNRTMILNPRYGATSLIGVSYFVFVEFLGPMIELFGYIAIPILYYFGMLNMRFFAMLVLLAIFWGISINVGAVFLDIYNFRRYKKTSDILRLCVLGALEFFGYRQIMLIERLKATLTFRKKDWGSQDRRTMDLTGAHKELK
jgi:cellulose synthase/poly-beta-1,6-N-acetylglucosamine synthase-like glycosyltransferase